MLVIEKPQCVVSQPWSSWTFLWNRRHWKLAMGLGFVFTDFVDWCVFLHISRYQVDS